jgi:hypothetical protein
MRKFYNYLQLFIKPNIFLFITLITISSCGGSDKIELKIPFETQDYKLNKDFFTNYFNTSLGYTSSSNTEGDIKIYIDRSSGISDAFNSPLGGEVAKSMMTKIAAKYGNAKYFGITTQTDPINLGNSPINYVINNANYDQTDKVTAKLANTMNSIVKENNLSFVITDCEEFDDNGKERYYNDPWAKDAFITWLNQGNSINFWISDFKKGAITKHLYFIAFVPKNVSNSNFTDLEKDMDQANPTHLELTNQNWKIIKPSWSESTTGLHKSLQGPDVFNQDTYVRNFDNSPSSFEFMEINLPLEEGLKQQMDASNDFYRGLNVDLSNNIFFNINDIDLNVSEVTDDIISYSTYEQVKTNKPTLVDDGNNKKILDPNNVFSSYYSDPNSIKKEYIYIPNFKTIKEVFSFDKTKFKNSLSTNPKSVELGINLHQNFNAKDANLSTTRGYNVLRVDFKISGFNENQQNLDSFQWQSAVKSNSGKMNTGLLESIKQAIAATKPKDKIVHSLFIKIINSK